MNLITLLVACVEHTAPGNIDCVDSVQNLAPTEETPFGTGNALMDADDGGTVVPDDSNWPSWTVWIDRSSADVTYVQRPATCATADTVRIDSVAELQTTGQNLSGNYYLEVDGSRESQVIASWSPDATAAAWIVAAVQESRPDLDTLQEVVVTVDLENRTASLRPQMVDPSGEGGLTQIQPEASSALSTSYTWTP